MATTSKRKTTDKNPSIPDTPSITVIKKASTKSLEGRGKLDYELGTDEAGALHWRIAKNSGGGFFSDEWIPFSAIQAALEAWPVERPITSMALRTLFQGKSVNTPSFLLAALLCEGVVRLLAGKRRQYELGDVAAFLKSVKATKAPHSKPRKPRAKAKAKAGTRIRKAPAAPAKAE
ncbi:conserved hypothetical protein [Luminiphilus syltensis NOR5-1B]|uniref:Uncharacterized protein n=1 Tax=Luminiphilus syltensis NOR5-1B TaxID=565045 RepID=B8KVR1_9GAMM|nr:hypothetical protein [Luminiphilus syltensis]EED35828.1 conserved hypothetical protein [Luminiphilus syltensis NOR5-1B]